VFFQLQRYLFFLFIRIDGCVLGPTGAGDPDFAKLDLGGVQDKLRGGLQHLHLDGLIAREVILGEIGGKRQFVVFRHSQFWQALRRGKRRQQPDYYCPKKDPLHRVPSLDFWISRNVSGPASPGRPGGEDSEPLAKARTQCVNTRPLAVKFTRLPAQHLTFPATL